MAIETTLPGRATPDEAFPQAPRAASRHWTAHHYVLVPGAVLVLALPWAWLIPDLVHTVLVVAQLVLCAFGIVGSYVRGLRPMRMVFSVFLLSWLGVGPLYQLSHRQLAWNDSSLLDDRDAVTGGLALTLLFTALVFLTMWMADARRPARLARPLTPVEPRPWLAWGYLGALLALSPYVILSSGGIGGFFTSRAERIDELTASGVTLAAAGGLQVAIVQILPAALAVAAAHLFIARIRIGLAGRSWWDAPLPEVAGLVTAVALMAVYANPLSNTRFISIAAFGSLALAVLQPRTRRAAGWLVVLLLVATLGVYPLSHALTSEDADTVAGQSALSVLGGQDFDGFQQVVNAQIFVQDQGHSDGLYTASALLFAVPRSVWPDKATPASIDVAANRDYWFTNLSLPPHAEIYIDFGLPGVLVLAIALGFAWSRIDEAWLYRPAGTLALLAPYLALAQLGFIRGPLGSLAPVWLTVMVLLALGVRTVRAGGGTEDRPGGGAAWARTA